MDDCAAYLACGILLACRKKRPPGAGLPYEEYMAVYHELGSHF